MDVVNPAIPCRIGEGHGYQKRISFFSHGWILLFFDAVHAHGKVVVSLNRDGSISASGNGLDVPCGIHLGVVSILHFGYFKLDTRQRDSIGGNLIGLLSAALSGGFCDIFHPVFVNGQAPRYTAIG